MAQAIDALGRCRVRPFVAVDCTTIPPSLAESVLSGHEVGKFAGAVRRQISPFVPNQKGDALLRRTRRSPARRPAPSLRALAACQTQSVGPTRVQPIDLRVVAAIFTHRWVPVSARLRGDLVFRSRPCASTVSRLASGRPSEHGGLPPWGWRRLAMASRRRISCTGRRRTVALYGGSPPPLDRGTASAMARSFASQRFWARQEDQSRGRSGY